MENTLPTIELKLTTRGFYHWNITYPIKEPLSSYDVARGVKELDSALRDAFPNNTAQLKTSSFKKFIDED